jgi:hypothetical protein
LRGSTSLAQASAPAQPKVPMLARAPCWVQVAASVEDSTCHSRITKLVAPAGASSRPA